MKFLKTKTGIAIILLIGLFGFVGAGMNGVFGNTQIGLTLFSNASLNNGLVGHWTFDSTDVSGFTVSDRSGNNNDGTIIATTTRASEVQVDSLVSDTDAKHTRPGLNMIWISDQVGYLIYADAFSDGSIASTTDAGATWSSAHQLYDEVDKITAWYDQWTPGDESGTLIHTLSYNATDDDLSYSVYDTSSDTSVNEVAITTTGAGHGITNAMAITKAEDGTLYATIPDGSGTLFVSCSSNCTSAGNWSNISSGFADDDEDIPTLLPLAGTNNIVLMYLDISADNLYYNVYSATSSSWWGVQTIVSSVDDNSVARADILNATLHKSTGNIILTYIDDADDYVTADHDIDVWEFDNDTFTWTEHTNVISGAALTGVNVTVDQNRDNYMYVSYVRRTNVSDSGTENIYYKLSTDGGTTWSGEIGPINSSEEDIMGLGSSAMSNERLSVNWAYAGADDLYSADLADIGDYADEKVVPGNIGQGLVFDGVDDYVTFTPTDPDEPVTLAAWFKLDSLDAQQTIINLSDGATGGGQDQFSLNINAANGIEAEAKRGSSPFEAISTEVVRTGEWYHAVAVFESSTNRRIYVNGVLEDTDTNTEDVGGTQTLGTIGARNEGGYDRFVDGTIDDARVYNRALSDTEITRLYQLGATTKINKTLNSNPDLENGLVGHWTFDSTDVSGFDVLDRSGNNNDGSIVATSTQAEVVVDADTQSNGSRWFTGSPQTVWVTDQIGYVVYPDSTGIAMGSTTDGGATWASETVYSDSNAHYAGVWYDQWTPGDTTGAKIHILMFDIGDEDLYYAEYDTANNTLSSSISILDNSSPLSNTNYGSIARTSDGNIYAALAEGGGSLMVSCSSGCTNASNWSSLAAGYPGTDGQDYPLLLPMKDSNKLMFIHQRIGNNSIEYDIYNPATAAWAGTSAIVTSVEEETGDVDANNIGATINKNTGDIYLIYGDDVNDFVTEDHDIDVWKFENDTSTWSELTQVIDNTASGGGIVGAKIAVDLNREGHLYAIYIRRTTIGTDTTANLYYKVSYDDGQTWSAEKGPMNGTEDDLDGLLVNIMSDERITASWNYDTAPNQYDLYTVTIADIGDYADEKVIPGNIGQGLEFDGVDDYVETVDISAIETGDHTLAAWVYVDDFSDENAIFTKQLGSGANGIVLRIETDGSINVWRANPASNKRTAAGHVGAKSWHHVSFVYYEGTNDGVVFVDGVQVANSQADNALEDYGNTAFPVIVGRRVETAGNYDPFDGKIDDARLYNRVLSAAEILRLYELGATTKINKTLTTNPDLENGLVGHWTFDGKDRDTSSTTAEVEDRSGNLNHGDMQGYTSVQDGFGIGVLGQALEFDVSNGDEVHIDTLFGEPTEVTLAAWVNLEDVDTSGSDAITLGDNVILRATYVADSRGLEGGYRQTGSWNMTSSGVYIEDTGWRHIAYTQSESSNSQALYLDGVQIDSDSYSDAINYDQGDDTSIGAHDVNSNFEFGGQMDDVRVYNRALSDEEILRLYQLGN